MTSNYGRISVERQLCTLYNVVDVDSVNTLGLFKTRLVVLWYKYGISCV